VPNDVRVVAIVSTFNPPADLPRRIAEVAQQVDTVVVVDDGSSSNDSAQVLNQVRNAGGVVIVLPENSGIAAALNRGIGFATRELTPDWFITLDQDSEMCDGYVSSALASATQASAAGINLAFVCAESINSEKVPTLDPSAAYPEAFDPLQSGCMIPAETFRKVGSFDEELFIDTVDTDFTARVRRQGMKTIMGRGCNLAHTVGEARPMTILGWHVTLRGRKNYVHYHAPFRVYYITRNSVILAKRYFLTNPGWIAKRFYTEYMQHLVRFLYGPNRRQHVIAFATGLRDGVLGRSGRISPTLAVRLRRSPAG
jgi:rhamnosyltransferase